LSSATAVSVEPISSASQIVRSFLRRPSCSQSFWKTSTRSPSLPLTRRQTRSSGRWSISGADQRQTAGVPSPKTGRISTPPSKGDRPDLDPAVEGRGADAARRRVAPDREVEGPRGDRVELLVGVAQREVPVAAAVLGHQREVGGHDGVCGRRVEPAPLDVAGVDEEVLVHGREERTELAALGVQVHHDLGHEARLAEHLVQQQPETGDLVVVDGDEEGAGLVEQLTRSGEPGPHHLHPRCVSRGTGAVLVVVGEVVAGVVGRVDVDHVDLTALQLGQLGKQGQYLGVVALDEDRARARDGVGIWLELRHAGPAPGAGRQGPAGTGPRG
jgi:hypothetical protein